LGYIQEANDTIAPNRKSNAKHEDITNSRPSIQQYRNKTGKVNYHKTTPRMFDSAGDVGMPGMPVAEVARLGDTMFADGLVGSGIGRGGLLALADGGTAPATAAVEEGATPKAKAKAKAKGKSKAKAKAAAKAAAAGTAASSGGAEGGANPPGSTGVAVQETFVVFQKHHNYRKATP
jgi:hypothetical protein